MIIISSGKFSKPRSPRKEDQEIEQAFRQITETGNNGSTFHYTPPSGSHRHSVKESGCPGKNSQKCPSGKYQKSGKSSSRYSADKMDKNKKITIISLISVCMVLVICLSVGIWYYFHSTSDDGLIYANVYAVGINLGGKTPAEASDALHAATDGTYTAFDLRIVTKQGTLVLSPEKTGAKLDVDKLVDNAYQYGRHGTRMQRAKAKAAADLTKHELEILPYLSLNKEYIRDEIHRFLEEHSSSLVPPKITISGERPDVTKVPEDPDQIFQTLTVSFGTPELTMDGDALYNTVIQRYENNDYTEISAEFSVKHQDKIQPENIFETYCIAPVDAVLDRNTYEITSEIWGYGIGLNELTSLLTGPDAAGVIDIPLKFIKPDITAKQLQDSLFQDTLAECSSNYNQYNYPRANNLHLAAEAINGTILLPGETFSFNDTVGERTTEKGYQDAGAYVDGETVDQVGGGVCQVASTIYYCTLLADLETIDREEHMFAVGYVPLGMDATINWDNLDFAFRNNTKYPIRMETKADDGEVYVALYGTDEKDYYVEMEYEIEETYEYKSVEKKFPAKNPKGYEDGDVVTDGHTGYDVKTYRCKYSNETDELIERVYEATSNFDKQDEVICVIEKPKPTEPVEPTPTTPDETQPGSSDESIPDNSEESEDSSD